MAGCHCVFLVERERERPTSAGNDDHQPRDFMAGFIGEHRGLQGLDFVVVLVYVHVSKRNLSISILFISFQ